MLLFGYCLRVNRGEFGAMIEMALDAALSSERRDAFGDNGGKLSVKVRMRVATAGDAGSSPLFVFG